MLVSEQAVWSVPRGGVVFAVILAVMAHSFNTKSTLFAFAIGILLSGFLLRVVLHVLDERGAGIDTGANGAWEAEDPGDCYATDISYGMLLIGIVLVALSGLIALV